MRVVFMGTPEIAAGILKSLIASRHEVVGVVTQPDKPNARGNEIIFSDVKKVALEHSIPVFQPEKASEETFVESIRQLDPDIIVVRKEDLQNFCSLYPYTLLSAVKNHKVYPIESSWIDIVTPRNLRAIAYLRDITSE